MGTKTIWKEIEGYDDYFVSSKGEVKSYKRGANGRILKQKMKKMPNGKDSYMYVRLYSKNGLYKSFLVHVLVIEAFHSKRPEGMTVDHKNNNPKDNHIDNLQWIVQKENVRKDQADVIECQHTDGRKLIAVGDRQAKALTGIDRKTIRRRIDQKSDKPIKGWSFNIIQKRRSNEKMG